MTYNIAEKPWPERFGSQGVHIRVEGALKKVIYADIPWRRKDRKPHRKRIIITNLQGEEVRHIHRISVNRERGRVLFSPIGEDRDYMVYYLPYKPQKEYGYYKKGYTSHCRLNASWLWLTTQGVHHFSKNFLEAKRVSTSQVVSFYARTPVDVMYPMKTPLTSEEFKSFRSNHAEGWSLIGEYREYPIWMEREIPVRWVDRQELNKLELHGMKHEYLAFQLALIAWDSPLKHISVEFPSLGPIPSDAFTCYNTDGVDMYGNPFTRDVSVDQGKIQPLWVGIDIPRDVPSGSWDGSIIVKTQEGERKVEISLHIGDEVLEDRGDSDPTRFSRIRWMNSTIALENSVIPGFSPLKLDHDTIEYGEKTMTLNTSGLPSHIIGSHPTRKDQPKRELLDNPIRLDGFFHGNLESLKFVSSQDSDIMWEQSSSNESVSCRLSGHTEFDGYTRYRGTISAIEHTSFSQGVTLHIPISLDEATYFMGLGHKGSKLPHRFKHRWRGPYNSFWVGNTQIGVHCTLLGSSYEGPMQRLYKPGPPPAWYNKGKGRVSIEKEGSVGIIQVSTGPFALKSGESLDLEWAFLLTPTQKVHPKRQFTERYNHFPTLDKEGKDAGVKIVNIHHATDVNPYINYPFLKNKELSQRIEEFRNLGVRTKVYYTLRELTSRLPELPFLLSLGDEVLTRKMARRAGLWFSKPHPWLQEHVDGGCGPEWYSPFEETDEIDIALLTSGESRWYNYYLEGLDWMMKNLGIAGIYMDDVSFDRTIVKRIKRILSQDPEARIDLHSNTGFSKGPATQYTTFFPFMDKLWFGESFNYNKMTPEQYLVESSGIPFGLMGDMLQDGGHRWRGMLYGMTNRYPWPDGPSVLGERSPLHIWKLWDSFGIADAEMIGYWENFVPVTTSDPQIPATVYQKEGVALVALASWAKKDKRVTLSIDWEALGIDPGSATCVLPHIEHFQERGEYKKDHQFEVPSGRGLLILIQSGRKV